MDSTDKYLLWVGIALSLWVAYQSITGKVIYKRTAGRREEDPPTFWLIMALEGVGAVACLGYGLGLTLLATGCAGLVELTALGVSFWAIGGAFRRTVKYPFRIFIHLNEGRPQEAAQELRSCLARRPGDRETLYLLAGACEQAGERAAAWDLYLELAQVNDGWGRGAKIFLRKHGGENRVAAQARETEAEPHTAP